MVVTEDLLPLSLPPLPASVRRARHHVIEILHRAGRPEWADDAAQAVSEIVTNAVIHAATTCEVAVRVDDDGVHLAVRDFDPGRLLEQHLSRDATTGRGLSLVAALSVDCGVHQLGSAGKVVWCVIGSVAAGPGPHPDWMDATPEAGGRQQATSTALLAGVPTTLWLADLEHATAVLRELYLVRVGSDGSPVDGLGVDLGAAGAAVRRLTAATDRVVDRTHGTAVAVRPATLDGPGGTSSRDTIDVVVLVDDRSTRDVAAFQDALDLGQELAARGRLLVRPALAELVALRDWACDQVVAQAAGVPATPWNRSWSEQARLSRPEASPPADWDDSAVRASSRPAIAADDSNRIIAASPAATVLVGRPLDDLVGQRITAIIPARFREVHVAGFTRHLTTGRTTVLGTALVLPVLRSDGTEVLCDVLITQEPAEAGRHVFVARLDPVTSPAPSP